MRLHQIVPGNFYEPLDNLSVSHNLIFTYGYPKFPDKAAGSYRLVQGRISVILMLGIRLPG